MKHLNCHSKKNELKKERDANIASLQDMNKSVAQICGRAYNSKQVHEIRLCGQQLKIQNLIKKFNSLPRE